MTSRKALRVRLRLIQVGLFLPVLVTVALAVSYVMAVLARQRAVDAAGQQLVRRLVEMAIVDARRTGDEAANTVLGDIRSMQQPTAGRLLAHMNARTDSLRACACGPLKEGAFAFVWVPSTGQLDVTGAIPPGRDPRDLIDSARASVMERSGSIRGPGGINDAGPWLLHLAGTTLASGERAIAGIDISMDSWWTGTIVPGVEAAHRRYLPAFTDADSVLSASLVGEGLEVMHRGGRFAGPADSIVTHGESPFYLRLTLNPAILPVILSAAAPPSYTVIAGALIASLGASLLALILLGQVRRSIAQREAFVASISHELRTPLTEVLLHAETLALDRKTPAAKERAAGAIVRETRRLIGLVENALTIAGAGRPAPAPMASRPAAPVIGESLQSLELAAEQRQVRFETDLDAGIRATIDPVALDRIVTNLVDNAIRYGPSGQVVRVMLTRGIDPSRARLVVDDQGPGIPARERKRVLRAFERGHAGRDSANSGVGLGLAIVSHLVESAGGSLDVHDAPGGGARFVVIMPCDPAGAQAPAPGIT